MKLEMDRLTRDFGDLRAVDSVSFAIREGEIWGFIGPNGAGKTTTLRMLATVDHPTSGDARINGYSITRDADKVRGVVGFMPDYFGSYPDLLVSEYLAFFARAYGLHGGERRARVKQIVDFVEVAPLLGRRVADLSKGMRQRTSLVRSLLHDPQILLLDEPAAGLDPQARRDLRELLLVLAGDGKAILISSHVLAELSDLVTHVAIIDGGRLIYAGVPNGAQHAGELNVVMRIMGNLAASARLLLEMPAATKVRTAEPDVLRFRVSGGTESIAAIVADLVAHQQVPYHVTTDERALEKMYLDATQGNANGAERS